MSELTREQARDAYRSGLMRFKRHIAQGTAQHHGLMRTDADHYRDGMAAVAEATVAAFLGLSWDDNPHRKDHGADVGDDIGVRWTPLGHGGLIVYPGDRDDVRQVLVVGYTYPLRIAGWMLGRDAKREEWWRKWMREPTYLVPQKCLRGIDELTGIISHTKGLE